MGVQPIRYRPILLELWAMFALACAVGFMGPFGTYRDGSLIERIQQWWMLLMGAYVLIRPCIALLRRLAEHTGLPEGSTVGWGVAVLSLPLAMIWRAVGQETYRELEGYAELVPFSLLCAMAVLAASWWAAAVERRLLQATGGVAPETQQPGAPEPDAAESDPGPRKHRLAERLSAGFEGPIVALQSDDHYVHVHGRKGRELLLIRLREAIAEMGDEPGEQIHRSWWVARSGIDKIVRSGRSWNVHLINGEVAPVSRDAIYRLRQSGFLSDVA